MFAACDGGGEGDSFVYVRNPAGVSGVLPLTQKRIVFVGDSLTQGYTLPQEQTYPSIIGKRLSSLSLPFTISNSSVSGDTTENALNRINTELTKSIDILVLALGANDAEDNLRATLAETNLQLIIDQVTAVNPQVKIIIAGINLPRFFAGEKSNEYKVMYQRLATKNGASLIPNLLAGVAGNPSLNLNDGIHPNASGHRIMAETVWAALSPLVGASAAEQ